MNKILVFMLMSLASVVTTQSATTITAGNAQGGIFAQQIQLLPGVPYVNGEYMIGTFTSSTFSTGQIRSLDDWGWVKFGSAPFSSSSIAPGIFGAFMGAGQSPGVTGNLPTTATGPFIGNDIYVVISNPSSTEWIIWNSNQQFAVEDPVLGGAAVNIILNPANDAITLVRGWIYGANTDLGGPLASFNGGQTFVFVPEPSAALLGLVGALGLLRRRRN